MALARANSWLWLVPAILLVMLAIGRHLDTWALISDEGSTQLIAGAYRFGPRSLVETLVFLEEYAPGQTWGWSLLMNIWGRITGWSVPGVRALSWLIGALTLALVYRAGRDMYNHRIGFVAFLLLATSAFFVSFMRVAREFTLVAMFTTVALYCYWRIALHSSPAGRKITAGLLLGGAGLLYSHFFAALLLPALTLFHLFFVRKDRRWWRVALILVLIALSALPQLQTLQQGVNWNLERFAGKNLNLSALGVLLQLLHYFSNSLFFITARQSVSGTVPGTVVLLLYVLLVLLSFRRMLRLDKVSATWYLSALSALCLGLALVANAFVPVLLKNRFRYLMVLWPSVTLLGAVGISYLSHVRRPVADIILTALIVSGSTLILYGPFNYVEAHNNSYIHIPVMELHQHARPDDLLLVQRGLLQTNETRWNKRYYANILENPRAIMEKHEGSEQLIAQQHARIWLLFSYRGAWTDDFQRELEKVMVNCQTLVDRSSMILTLYAVSVSECN